MQSLVKALEIKGLDGLVANKVESFLSLDDLSESWCFTSKLAFQEVKQKVKQDVVPHSVWHARYLARTQPCTLCNKRVKKEDLILKTQYVYKNLVKHKYLLCFDCYGEYSSERFFLCTKCRSFFDYQWGDWIDRKNYCPNCETLYCYQCKAAKLVESQCRRLPKCFCCEPCLSCIHLE